MDHNIVYCGSTLRLIVITTNCPTIAYLTIFQFAARHLVTGFEKGRYISRIASPQMSSIRGSTLHKEASHFFSIVG